MTTPTDDPRTSPPSRGDDARPMAGAPTSPGQAGAEPANEGALESLGRAVSQVVTGTADDQYTHVTTSPVESDVQETAEDADKAGGSRTGAPDQAH